MTSEPPILKSDRLLLRMAAMEDIPYILNYFIENKEYLTPFYPEWDENFFTQESTSFNSSLVTILLSYKVSYDKIKFSTIEFFEETLLINISIIFSG